MPRGGELTCVVLSVVDLESRGAFTRFDDFPVVLTLDLEAHMERWISL